MSYVNCDANQTVPNYRIFLSLNLRHLREYNLKRRAFERSFAFKQISPNGKFATMMTKNNKMKELSNEVYLRGLPTFNSSYLPGSELFFHFILRTHINCPAQASVVISHYILREIAFLKKRSEKVVIYRFVMVFWIKM